MPVGSKTTGRRWVRSLFKWVGIGCGIVIVLFVALLEVAWVQKAAADYRSSIVRDTVEALKHEH